MTEKKRKRKTRRRPPAEIPDDGAATADVAPPRARWPLVVLGLAYGAWMVFLLLMAFLRIRETARF